ncbi:hypothetical protein BDD43_2132 [Mucilaginibacter gracilis]|uniref:Uncharacterized protein n=1 Tax=Mucilaginibacter gracilis TaxID=423350 RepID=A0A495IZ18_9SPHI|nr:hypothetical protein BDD43_2132 [Mucilaginibacter gracilis]
MINIDARGRKESATGIFIDNNASTGLITCTG